jgi:hypothetical protein
MVLKNSKWDKKAKYQFMKKHGISTKPPSDLVKVDRPKWSGKRKDGKPNENQIILVDSEDEDEWDSDADDALINHFYPQLGDELTKEQKAKVKQQILQEFSEENDMGKDLTNDKEDLEGPEEIDGIYLGKEPEKEIDTSAATEMSGLSINLQDLIKPNKTRKLLRPKISDNILEEYGISSYKDVIRDNSDYNDVFEAKKKDRHLNDISAKELDGFVIGESLSKKSKDSFNHVQYLSTDEIQVEKERAALAEKNRLFKQIKNRFAPGQEKNKSKVLEIDNLNVKDHDILANLNTKLARSDREKIRDDEVDEYLDIILDKEHGASEVDSTTRDPINSPLDLDEILAALPTTTYKAPKNSHGTTKKPTNYDDTFLDELLG